MESRCKLMGHALHQMLVNMPLALIPTTLGFDLVRYFTKRGEWGRMAQTTAGIGIVSGAAAAIPGWIDWFAIPNGTRAKKIGLIHGVGNTIVLTLFTIAWVLRRGKSEKSKNIALLMTGSSTKIVLLTAWLGGELVDRLGVGVDDDADLDAPNSLTHASASDDVPTQNITRTTVTAEAAP